MVKTIIIIYLFVGIMLALSGKNMLINFIDVLHGDEPLKDKKILFVISFVLVLFTGPILYFVYPIKAIIKYYFHKG